MNRRTFLGLLGLIGCKDINEDCMNISKKNWWIENQSGDPFLTNMTNIVALGDSITFGSNASPSSNSYINLFKASNSIATIQNGAVSGRGVWQMIDDLHDYSPTGLYTRAVTLMTAMVGLNDIRRGGSAAKTLAKIQSCYRAYIIKHYFPNVISPRDAAVTKSGSFTNYDANATGGLPASANYSTTSGAYWEYTFSGKSIAVMFMGLDGVTSTGWGKADIYIDGAFVEEYDSVGKYDAISDGAYNNAIGPVGWYKLNLSDASHTIRIVAQTTANIVIDYFATGATPSNNYKALFCEIPYLNTTGYAIAPSNGSVAISNTASQLISDIVTDLASYGYKIKYAPTNSYYVLATGLDTDNIHPNNTGHSQIKNALQSVV